MSQYKKLMAEAQAAATKAAALIQQYGDEMPPDTATEVDGLLTEAEAKRDQAHEAKKSEALAGRAKSLSAFFGESEGVKAAVPAGDAAPDAARAKQDALIALRYGSITPEAKSLARDLYGADYEAKRLGQAVAFGKYIRLGENALTADDYRLLKGEPILTPGQISEAAKYSLPLQEVKATLVEASDTLGGYLVPEDLRLDIIQRLAGQTVVRGRATTITTTRDAVDWPKLNGGNDQYTSAVRVTWVAEQPTAGTAATNPTFGFERIPVHTVMAETFLSRNLLEDVAVDLVGLLSRLFAEATAIDEDYQFLVGSGVGKPQGIMPGGTPLTGITLVASGNASAVTADGLKKLKRGVARQYRNNGVYIGNSDTAQAIELLKDGQGLYLFDLDGDVMLRKPWLEDESMPDIAGNAYPVLYGDLGAYVIVDRVGMSVERYLDSSTARANQVVYVMRRRLGGQLLEPWRFSALKIATTV